MARIDGTNGNDNRDGTSGADVFYMKDGADKANGLGGADEMHGGGGNDTLNGGAGTDTLYGGDGNDHLSGGDGRDILVGGNGYDELYGGAGGDQFRFTNTDRYDVIVDFKRSEDVIDLRDIDADWTRAGDQAYAYIGNAAFSGHAGELRYEYDAARGRGELEGDNNGDGQADFVVYVQLTPQLGAGDFLF